MPSYNILQQVRIRCNIDSIIYAKVSTMLMQIITITSFNDDWLKTQLNNDDANESLAF